MTQLAEQLERLADRYENEMCHAEDRASAKFSFDNLVWYNRRAIIAALKTVARQQQDRANQFAALRAVEKEG